MRRRLAAGLQHTAEVLRRCLVISTGEVAPDTGLLAAASGETSERIGLDSGLYSELVPLYAAGSAAGATIQVGWCASRQAAARGGQLAMLCSEPHCWRHHLAMP